MTNDHRGECRSDSPLSPLPPSFFIAFCRILPTNVVVCRLQSIAKYSTLYFAFCKACARGIPLDPFHEVRTYTQPTVKCASCGASPPPTGFRHRPQGRFKPSGTNCPSVLISYHAKASCQWWLRHFFASKKASH